MARRERRGGGAPPARAGCRPCGLALPRGSGTRVLRRARLAFIVVYSFGYKPRHGRQHSVGLDRLSLRQLPQGARHERSAYETFTQTLRIAVARHRRCACVIAFPLAYWMAVKVPSRWQRRAARAGHRAVLDELPDPHDRLAHRARRRKACCRTGCRRSALARLAAPAPRHPRGRAARRRLQLPAAHDLPAVRGPRPARPGAAGGEQGSRRQPVADVPSRSPCRWPCRASWPGCCWCSSRWSGDYITAIGAGRGQGQHGRRAGRQPVPGGAELGPGLGHGGGAASP